MTSGRPHTVTVPRGYRIGRWEVGEPMGSGASATVYAGRLVEEGPVELPRRAALKVLPTGTRTRRRRHHVREVAEREADFLSRLHSPRLVRMYETLTVDDPDHPELDGATVLVLEQAERSLDVVPHPVPSPGAVLTQICEALTHVHRAGWVHGDLKPANVLLMADGSVRLADFSTAAELEGAHAYSLALATPDYTAPELLWPETDARGTRIRPTADIWAFGVLAHVVLAGSFPFPGGTTEARDDAALRYVHGAEELRLSPGLPEEWRGIVRDCLTPTPEDRAADTAALLRRVEQAAGTARPPRMPRPKSRRWRRPVALVTVLTALELAGSGVAYTALRDEALAAHTPPTCEKPAVFKDPTHGLGYTAGQNGTWDFTIEQGDGGGQVREVQCLLRHLHGVMEAGDAHGSFGPRTHQAVVTFQERAGLAADGTVDPATWRALRKGGES
ncbi:protein kinase [Streptomyces atrovirens]|uniref:Serine/threonine-protein kinase n=1 Tax=Streptomyces atrovirens TaxID=285556 RepID=A0ABW0DTI9_9ACTN